MEAGEATWRRSVGRRDASGGSAANGYAPSGAREVESGGAGEEEGKGIEGRSVTGAEALGLFDRGAAFVSALWWQRQRNGVELCPGRVRPCSAPGGGGLSPDLLELRAEWAPPSAIGHGRCRELDSGIPVGPFQLGMFVVL